MITFIKRHKILVTFLLLTIIGAPAATVYWRNIHTNRDKFFTLKRGTIIESVYGIGTIRARKSFDLRVGFATTINRLYVREGDQVKQGAKLVDLGGLKTYFAPFSGVISKSPFKEGETVFAQASLITLTDMIDRYVVVSIEQEAVFKILPGQAARLSFEGFRENRFEGTVEAVYASEGKFLVRIGITQLPLTILPEMTADVSIVIAHHRDVWLVPVTAIEQKKVRIRRENDTQMEEVEVEVKLIDGEMAQIVSDKLRVGDAILSP